MVSAMRHTRTALATLLVVLAASAGTEFIYLAIVAAAAARVAMAFAPDYWVPIMYAAASIWIAAFAVFLILYGPLLARSIGRAD